MTSRRRERHLEVARRRRRLVKLEIVTPRALDADAPAFEEQLRDAVDNGAGIGFLRPLRAGAASAYWTGVGAGIERGDRILLAARGDDGALLGSVQLALATWEAGAHRAELQKLLVHTSARKRGISKALMAFAERTAIERGRTLLILDTFEGTLSESLYLRWGWTPVGTIPRYATDPEGKLRGVVLFYKELAPL